MCLAVFVVEPQGITQSSRFRVYFFVVTGPRFYFGALAFYPKPCVLKQEPKPQRQSFLKNLAYLEHMQSFEHKALSDDRPHSPLKIKPRAKLNQGLTF